VDAAGSEEQKVVENPEDEQTEIGTYSHLFD